MQPFDMPLTLVVPVFNEIGSLVPLYGALTSVLGTLRKKCEIIFVDDGSTDGSAAALDEIAARDERVLVLHLRGNCGKSAALDAAFRQARGSIVITLDADMQNDPRDIPRFIEKIEQGADVVSGWRRQSQDAAARTVPATLFNAIARRVSGADIHDFNCGFKAYRAECLVDLRLYGGLHRFTPVLLHWKGFKVDEIEIAHHPRRSGQSKSGRWRIVTGVMDLLTVLLIGKFRSRPLHFFGYAALTAGSIAIILLGCLLVLSVFGLDSMRPAPLIYAAQLLILASIMLTGFGLIAELVKSMLPAAPPDYLIGTMKRMDEGETRELERRRRVLRR